MKNNPRMRFVLSDCSKLYLKALTDPFGMFPTAPCVPDLYDSPSKKFSVLLRGTFVVPAATPGVITFRARDAMFNGTAIGYASSASYAGAGIPVLASDPGVIAITSSQGPYSAAQNGPGAANIQNRCVGAGLRIRYIGTELNRGGLIIPFRHPQNQSVGGYTLAQCSNFRTTRLEPASRGWHGITWRPVDAPDYEYYDGPVAANPPGTAGSIVVLIAPCGAANTYEYELVSHHEVTGATDNTTRSESDVAGLSAIRSILDSGFDGDPSTTLFQEAQKLVGMMSTKQLSGYAAGAAKGAYDLYMGSM